MRRGLRTLLAAMLVGVGGLVSASPAPGSVATPRDRHQTSAQASAVSRAQLTRRLVGDLRHTGLRVSPGYPLLVSSNICAKYSYPALQTCWGNNPVSPYVVPVLKAWPGEQVGPTPANLFGPVRRGYTPLPRLGPRDAIVLYGRMPPPAKYTSVQTWVWSQPGHWKTGVYERWAHTAEQPYPMRYLFSTIPPNDPRATRTLGFSSLGDIVNNVVMERRSGSPFGRQRYFVITPSATTDRAVRRALHAQGVRDSHIFTEQIPSRSRYGPIGPLGMGRNALDFLTIFKLALPDSQQAALRWWAKPPLTVMRVRAGSALGPDRRYGRVRFGRRTAHSEAHLAGDLQSLVNAVCERAGGTVGMSSADCAQPAPASSLMRPWQDRFGWQGPYCLRFNMWCGDMNDAGLFWTRPLPLDSGQVYAVVDTLATETGNATYVGLSVNDAATFLAPTGVTDATLKGSAAGYASTVPNTGRFFVHYFTRDCARLGGLLDRPQDCTSITTEMVPASGDAGAVGHPELKGMFWPGIRDYIAPGTAHGPDTSKMLIPRILVFARP